MEFKIKKAVREQIHTKIALMAPSGGGKTYGALRLATGMAQEIKKETGKEAKILMGNTEQKRGYYYADEFDYDIIDICAPHNPEKYVDLIDYAVKEGYDILILDSTSHEWEGKGGCLDLQQQAGGTYQSWGKVTPRHNKFMEAIAESPIHIIATMRGKDQYEMIKDDKTGKASVQKLGVGAKQRDGFEYEFTCTFLIDQKTNASEPQKDNSHIFEGQGPTILTEKHGEMIIKWANDGEVPFDFDGTRTQIIDLAKELGGSKDEEVSKIVNGVNPKKCDDKDILTKMLKELTELKETRKKGEK